MDHRNDHRRLHAAWWLAAAGGGVLYLIAAHRAHLAGLREWLPLLVLLACPLMHVFHHHRRHGSHTGHDDQDPHREDATSRLRDPP